MPTEGPASLRHLTPPSPVLHLAGARPSSPQPRGPMLQERDSTFGEEDGLAGGRGGLWVGSARAALLGPLSLGQDGRSSGAALTWWSCLVLPGAPPSLGPEGRVWARWLCPAHQPPGPAAKCHWPKASPACVRSPDQGPRGQDQGAGPMYWPRPAGSLGHSVAVAGGSAVLRLPRPP